ncbi:enoyl-ACP reductase FabI [Ideonella sp. A 288]|uniref:enoyl-ACP reductase FabI n=1 Tax=Ideonella sp. A 288 TaxID=1962181 RepID=UPI000B4B0F82|nr:enoyl-ACP reductase FabI [Ideonella sp. A 288]
MSSRTVARPLEGKNILVTGIADEKSIAWGCAKAFHDMGASLAVTYRNDRDRDAVGALAERLEALCLPLDVMVEGQMKAVFERLSSHFGVLHSALHSIAFAPKADLHGSLTDCSRAGFLKAMDCSCYSFIEMAHYAAPLMTAGGTLFTMSYHGAHRVTEHYNVMGPVKAALESSMRYLAHELGRQGIRVHAISPGPIRTRAASGIADFEDMANDAEQRAPAGAMAGIEDVGYATAMLAVDSARMLTGSTVYVDGGAHIMN